MPEKGSRKCKFCRTWYSAKDLEQDPYYITRKGELMCWPCYEASEQYASTLVSCEREWPTVLTTKFDDHLTYWTSTDDDISGSDDNEYPYPIVEQDYHRTDAWRGYTTFNFSPEVCVLASGWVTGYPDESVSRKFSVAEFFEACKDMTLNESLPADIYWVFGVTSNIFSQTCDVLVKRDDVEIWERWLKTHYGADDVLEGWLS